MESIAINNDGLLSEPTYQLNQPITLREIQEVISRLKPGKATGCDNLPNEILRQPRLLNFLYGLFNVCFRKGIVPSDWAKSNIKPIPKRGKDSMVPLNNRGISLMSTVAKVYNSILNQRLCIYTAITNTLSDEQNGFPEKPVMS